MEYKFKYQLHAHTSPPSKCGVMTSRELCRALYEGGYSGAVLTNHFMGGNTAIDRSLPWNEFVRVYEKDYLDAKEEAERLSLDIIFGIEEQVGGGLEILLYGITPEWLYEHPELSSHRLEDYRAAANEIGALIVQAHPYRERYYISTPGPLPISMIDGIEVFNRANKANENQLAEALAQENPHLIRTAGADAHTAEWATFSGIATKERITDCKKLVEILKSGDYRLIKE